MENQKEYAAGKGVDNLSRTEIEHIVDEWIHNEVHRLIIKRRLLDGITYERLAEEFDYSPRHIKNIVYKCMDKICVHL